MKFNQFLLECDSAIIYGQRGSGKSTLFAKIADLYNKNGIPVYSQYAYKFAHRLPLIRHYDKKTNIVRYDLDKSFLYSSDFYNCCILIDECATVYPARKFGDWNDADDDFFNFLRKKNIHLFISTQFFDKVDLNVRRACSYSIYLEPSFFNFSKYDICYNDYKRILNKQVDRKSFVSEFACVETDYKRGFFNRKKFYHNFDTYFVLTEKRPVNEQLTSLFIEEEYNADYIPDDEDFQDVNPIN